MVQMGDPRHAIKSPWMTTACWWPRHLFVGLMYDAINGESQAGYDLLTTDVLELGLQNYRDDVISLWTPPNSHWTGHTTLIKHIYMCFRGFLFCFDLKFDIVWASFEALKFFTQQDFVTGWIVVADATLKFAGIRVHFRQSNWQSWNVFRWRLEILWDHAYTGQELIRTP